jgi:hypothetical protein
MLEVACRVLNRVGETGEPKQADFRAIGAQLDPARPALYVRRRWQRYGDAARSLAKMPWALERFEKVRAAHGDLVTELGARFLHGTWGTQIEWAERWEQASFTERAELARKFRRIIEKGGRKSG